MAVYDVVGKAVCGESLRAKSYRRRRGSGAKSDGTASYDDLRRARSEAESCPRDYDCWSPWGECLTSDCVFRVAVCSISLRAECQRRRKRRCESGCKSNCTTTNDYLSGAWSKADACS